MGHLEFRRQLEDPVDLGVGGAGVVLVRHPDAEPAGAQLGGDRFMDGRSRFRVHGGVVGLAEQVRVLDDEFRPGALGVEEAGGLLADAGDSEQAQPPVGHRGAVVEDRLSGAAFEEAPDPGDAALELQGGGHPRPSPGSGSLRPTVRGRGGQ